MDINDAWKSTCKVLLGDEIGGVKDYEKYLSKYLGSMRTEKSAISGKGVAVGWPGYCKGAKFISNDELADYTKVISGVKLDINRIKDMDSIFEAVREHAYYSGNKVLGNSQDVVESDNCIDAQCVYNSNDLFESSKFVAFADEGRNDEYCFSITITGESKFLIRSHVGFKNARCMDSLRTYLSSDCYYVANVEGCSNCMFSFNLRNRNFNIGNLQLTREKYSELKAKLVEEMRETLRTKKDLPSISEIIAGGGSTRPAQPEAAKHSGPSPELQRAFDTTSSLVLGRQLGKIDDYAPWLTQNVGRNAVTKSSLSGKPIYLPPYAPYLPLEGRCVTLAESAEMAKKSISEAEAGKLTLANAAQALKGISMVTPEDEFGVNSDMVECACYGNNSSHGYASSFIYSNKSVGYCYYPRNSEYLFGCRVVMRSNQCIKCYSSFSLSRCFELDGCNNCRDSYFCHNCEGLDNCMFCFNAKSLRYAIGNVEIGRENYMKVKKLLLDEISGKLEQGKKMGLSIYNVGMGGKR